MNGKELIAAVMVAEFPDNRERELVARFVQQLSPCKRGVNFRTALPYRVDQLFGATLYSEEYGGCLHRLDAAEAALSATPAFRRIPDWRRTWLAGELASQLSRAAKR